jgi:hypothetical protein
MNSLVRTNTIAATEEPVTLAAMKNWLKVPASVVNDDADITDLISEARMQAELLSNCALVRSTFVQYLDHFPAWGGREFDYYGSNPGGGSGSGGYGGIGYDRHQKWHGEITVKRPPLVSVKGIVFIGTDGRPYTLNPGQDFVVDIASKPGRIRPVPYTIWPLTLHVPAAIAISFTAGYAPNSDSVSGATTAEPETETESINPSWQPSIATKQYSYLIDPNSNVEVQMNAGTPSTASGDNPPAWPTAIGGTVSDGGCLWQNCGPIRGFWAPGVPYSGLNAYVINDFNSNLQLLNVASLISQNIVPYSSQVVGMEPLPWSQTVGGLTTDNGLTGAWRCLGAYNALGDTGLALPNSPEQQAAVTIDLTLPKTVNRFVKALVTHWYYNREPVVGGSVNKVPQHLEEMLGEVTIYDYCPTP